MSVFIDWQSLFSGALPNSPPPKAKETPAALGDVLRGALDSWSTAGTVAALVLGTAWALSVLYFLRSKRQGKAVAEGASAIDQRKDDAVAIDAAVQEALSQQMKSLERSFQRALDDRIEAIEDTIRKRVNLRVEALESRIRLDQDAIDSLHRSTSQRMEVLEEGVRIIDSKQLDQEATNVVQRSLSQRLETIEGSLQALERKTRASSQRVEAVDDSARILDSRTKALSQRMEAVEDNQGSVEGQVTLLSHDASRGGQAIERLAKQVKTMPGNERLRELSVAWEERFDALAGRLEQQREQQLSLEETTAEEPPATLSFSPIETQETEPSGPLYTQPPSYSQPPRPRTRRPSFGHTPSLSFDSGSILTHSMPPTPSSSGGARSDRSFSFTGSNSPTDRNAAASTPTNAKRRRMEMEKAGFQDTTFSSRQRLFVVRGHERTGSLA
ncbi:hypothetical protein BJ170DRAFT_223112 [Xylariales sp. AK1849]|nr:hypothetical protein BJ170DRAFT_223112 [Xylariales sp. AK1849]